VLDEKAVERKRSFLVIPSTRMWYRNSLFASWQNRAVKRDLPENVGWRSFIPIIGLLSVYLALFSVPKYTQSTLLPVKFEFW